MLGNGLARFLEEGAAVTPPPLLGNANRCTQIAQPNGTVSYTFDNANRRTGVNLSGTGDWTCAFDAANRLTSVTNPNSETTSFTLDNAGRITRQDNGNTTYTLNSFDLANRITKIQTKNSGGTQLSDIDYRASGATACSQREATSEFSRISSYPKAAGKDCRQMSLLLK